MTPRSNQAFVAELATKHSRRLRQFLLHRLPNLADVGDLAQEVYLRLLRVDRRESIRNPEAYLFTVAGHVVHQHLLREANAPLATADIEELLDLDNGASESSAPSRADAEQRLERMDERLARLPPRARAAFVLHLRDGYTLEEIAVQFGVSRSMVKKYLAKAVLDCDVKTQRALMERERRA